MAAQGSPPSLLLQKHLSAIPPPPHTIPQPLHRRPHILPLLPHTVLLPLPLHIQPLSPRILPLSPHTAPLPQATPRPPTTSPSPPTTAASRRRLWRLRSDERNLRLMKATNSYAVKFRSESEPIWKMTPKVIPQSESKSDWASVNCRGD